MPLMIQRGCLWQNGELDEGADGLRSDTGMFLRSRSQRFRQQVVSLFLITPFIDIEPDPNALRSLTPPTHILAGYRTLRNAFGLLRSYYSKQPPSHDPEERVSQQDLCDLPPTCDAGAAPLVEAFDPYPNESSFLLGDWYWNSGAQKSQKSFRDLVDIIASPGFKPEDIRDTRWSAIDRRLGLADFDEKGDEWEDEDASWKRTPIAIDVPFHRQMRSSEPWRQHVIGHLYHRSIVSVIKEKLANEADVQHFHYEPHAVFWKPMPEGDELRVHGELYTSLSFEQAYRSLQDGPGEPGCELPRCIVALMLWSDATLLTSFGKTQLWPVYLFFGNESKYRRCKPSLHLCNHIAYFEAVGLHYALASFCL
jgi:hypothetical protein